jgi:hypothetical protein
MGDGAVQSDAYFSLNDSRLSRLMLHYNYGKFLEVALKYPFIKCLILMPS